MQRGLLAPLALAALPIALVWVTFPESTASFWHGATSIAAWAGSSFLAASLLLMIREPRVAGFLGGLGNMYRWHHRGGMLAYVLLLCHPLALAMSHWSESPRRAWQTLTPEMADRAIWLGWIALILLMLGLATTFAMYLPYRHWRACHYALGAAAVIGLIHIHAVSGATPALFVLIALTAIALGWRATRADLGLAAHPYRVSSVLKQSSQMIEATLAPCAAQLRVTPGQFVLAAFGEGPHYHGCDEFHPFTVSAVEGDGALRVGIKALGPCTRRIQSLEPGVLVRLQGPFGNFLHDRPKAPQLWVAGGVGITPFLAVLRHAPVVDPTTLIYLYRNAADAVFLDELRSIAAAQPAFELINEATGDSAPDFDSLLTRVTRLTERRIQVCGPPAMTTLLTSALRRRGIAADSMRLDRFDFR
jgi:predicted ferric reductase